VIREALSVLMLAQGPCTSPEVKEGARPHLSPGVVLRLSMIEQPGGMMPL